MTEKRNEDESRWLEVLRQKEQLRAKRRRQVLIQKILIAVVILAVALSALVFAVTRSYEKNGSNSNQNDANKSGSQQQANDTQADTDTKAQQSEENTQIDTSADTEAETSLNDTQADIEAETSSNDTQADTDAQEDGGKYRYQEKTRTLGKGISSSHAVLVDVENGTILACKDEKSQIIPASMTKVLTLLTAVEQLTEDDLDDKFKITVEITDYCYLNDCSSAGFAMNEKVTVKDLLYGTILPSGADAALGLAQYVAGSQEAFVEMMNANLEKLGLSETAHFTNCVGIYDEDHYCTVLDMAAIMEAALSNDLCKEVLSARTYTTSKTKKHPEGILLSNWFLRRIEDKDTGGEVVCGKTGYVVQSGNCAVSYGIDQKERKYICVTTNAEGSWKCIYDHVKLYKRFSKRA